MNVPLEISFRGMDKIQSIEDLIRERSERLERYCDHISSCSVTVERTQSTQQRGQPFRVRIDLRIPPQHEIVVRREPHKGDLHTDLSTEVRQAFDAAEGQLKELVERQRGDVKVHPAQEEQGVVIRILHDQGYGFLRTLDGREVYFHRNSVLRDGFDELEEGSVVRYVEELGEEGNQASTVQIVEKPGMRVNWH